MPENNFPSLFGKIVSQKFEPKIEVPHFIDDKGNDFFAALSGAPFPSRKE